MMVSKNPPEKRNYAREAKYEDSPEQVRNRENRNRMRAQETKKLGHKPEGDVAHINPLIKGGGKTLANVKVESASANRSWRGGRKGYDVPTDPRDRK